MKLSEYLRKFTDAEVRHHQNRLERAIDRKDRARIHGRIEGAQAVIDALERYIELYGSETGDACWTEPDPYADGLLEDEEEFENDV